VKPIRMRRLASLVAALAAMAAAVSSVPATQSASSAAPATLRYGQVPPTTLGTPFQLTNQHGKPYSLVRTDGRHTLLTFGFTQCSATCPVSLYNAKLLLDQLGTQRAPAIVFVTLDPLNDSPDRLARYLERFHRGLIGLTGTPEAVERVVQAYRVGVQGGGQELAHSAVWYLIDPQGRTVRIYGFSTPVEQLASDMAAIAPNRAAMASH
jgi:protein SCO1/2